MGGKLTGFILVVEFTDGEGSDKYDLSADCESESEARGLWAQYTPPSGRRVRTACILPPGARLRDGTRIDLELPAA